MAEGLLCGDPLSWVFHEHLLDKFFGIIWDILKLVMIEGHFLGDDIILNFLNFFTLKWLLTAQKIVKDDPYAPYITALILVGVLTQVFRRGVIRQV